MDHMRLTSVATLNLTLILTLTRCEAHQRRDHRRSTVRVRLGEAVEL